MNKTKLSIASTFIVLFFATILFATTFTATYDTNTPLGSDDPAEADDRMREIKVATQERLNVEHRFALTGTEVSAANTGEHSDITTDSIVNAGTMTNAGTLGVTGDFAVNTSKFTVTAASGNTLVAGTLDVTEATELIGIATIADASVTKTTAAPTTDAMIANKKYVDDNKHQFGVWNDRDNDGSADVVASNTTYEAITDGIVTCGATGTGSNLSVLTDLSNPPTTLRVQAGGASGIITSYITCPVKKGDFWKAPTGNDISWMPIGN